MGQYSDIELLIIDKFAEAIGDIIDSKESSQWDKDKLMFAACINKEEKEKTTRKEIKKMQKKLKKCNPDIAEFLRRYINPSEIDLEASPGYGFRFNLIRNFLFQEFGDVLEVFSDKFKSIEDVENVEYLEWEEMLVDGHYGIDDVFISHFVMYMAYAQRLTTFRSILESEERDKKKPKIDVILDKMKAEVKQRESQKTKDELSVTLDNLRGQHISTLQLYNIIKAKTNLEKDALEYLKEDVGWYLFTMKMAEEFFYSKEQVEYAFNKIKEKGYSEQKLFELGYLKNKKTFFTEEYVDPEEPVYIDKEKLLFPNEFTSIKELLVIIDKELEKNKLEGKDSNTNNIEPDMYLRQSDYSLLGLINTAIYREIAYKTNNKPLEIKIELNAIVNDKKKIKYAEKEAIKRAKKLNEVSDDLERFQAIKFLEENINYKGNFYKLIDKYCKDFTNNLSTSFYNSISENEAKSLILSNSHPNANTIIDDICMINKLSKLDNSYILKSIENFKKYMVIAIETQFYKSTVLVLKPDIIKKPSIAIPLSKPKSKHQSFTYINNLSGQSNLTDLKDSLIRKSLIASDTALKDFRKIFSGEAVDKQIVWTGTISELSYFIKQLHNVLKLVVNLKQDHWAVTINCFIQKNGEQYNRKKLRTQKVPTTSKSIDSALNSLK